MHMLSRLQRLVKAVWERSTDVFWLVYVQLQHAVEVAVYNIISYLWEIENGSVYQMTRVGGLTSLPPDSASLLGQCQESHAEMNHVGGL
jgi:hypothetical protein